MEPSSLSPVTSVDEGNVLSVNVESIALDSRFGGLKFEKAAKHLTRIQKYLKEAKDLGYDRLLLQEDINKINNYTASLSARLQWLLSFDIASGTGNPKQEHDTCENEVEAFYNQVYKDVVMQYLPFLREENRRENPGERELDEEVRMASQVRADLEKQLQVVREDIEKIRETKQEVGSAKGERASANLSVYFTAEAQRYKEGSKDWRTAVFISYGFILTVIIFLSYRHFYVDNSTNPIDFGFKVLFVGALWYGLSFIQRNYNVNAHLGVVNSHRAAVANTLEDYLATNPEKTDGILKDATEAMFKHMPIGYVSKNEKESASPVTEVINNILGARSVAA